MHLLQPLKPLFFLLALWMGNVNPAPAAPKLDSAQPGDALHAPWTALLQKYVHDGRVNYRAWKNSREDLHALRSYLRTLQKYDPARWPRHAALAYWINLYNAATLNLVLSHYPISSIKRVRGFFLSPWRIDVVEVGGRRLSLDQIENSILRKQLHDARIHFALNCASLGCPPLASEAYLPSKIDAQLDAAATRTLRDSRWVDIREEEIRVTRLFRWYAEDFEAAAGSVRAFITRFRPADRAALLDSHRRLRFMKYDWRLNEMSRDGGR